MKIALTHYARKGIYAYICPLTIKDSQIERGDFINGQPREADKQRFYQGKSAIVIIDLDNLDDGLYEYKEASGHKTRFAYFELTGGVIGREWDTSQEMLEDLKPIPELPEL